MNNLISIVLIIFLFNFIAETSQARGIGGFKTHSYTVHFHKHK